MPLDFGETPNGGDNGWDFQNLGAVRVTLKAGLFGFFFNGTVFFSHNNSAETVISSEFQTSERGLYGCFPIEKQIQNTIEILVYRSHLQPTLTVHH